MSQAMTIVFESPVEAKRFQMDYTVRGIELRIPDAEPEMVEVRYDSGVNFERFHLGLKDRLQRIDLKRQLYRLV